MALTNLQYDTIMKEYEEQQQISRRQLQERQQEVESRLPDYSALEDQIVQAGIFYAKRALDGDPLAANALHDKLAELSARKAALLTGGGFPADYLEPTYHCADCKDTGFIDNRKCHCFKQKQTALFASESGLKELQNNNGFADISLSYYQGEHLNRYSTALSDAKSFVAQFPAAPANFLFYGSVGSGKSFLSACMAREILEKGYTVLYFSAISLFQLLHESSSEQENASSADAVFNCDLLIIDDLGCELTNRLTFSYLFQCINERILSKRSTIISTNLSLAEISDRYTDRVLSRLSEHYGLYAFSGPDIRIIKQTKTDCRLYE